ncbi:MAG TPA: 4-alpha-glucanotransferase [Solirubrobacteraceae bacterium]
MKNLPRSSGVQLHITSLPGGRLGAEAYRFVDWLAAAGQSWWQVLPLGPPDRHHSPYKSRSAFAAWPGLLADRRASVSAAELSDFRADNAWVEDWERLAGRGAVAHQVRFQREWGALRGYAAQRGVRLFGDLAIYVAPDSADHRAHPELFQDGLVAGAPPDAFSSAGQLWGNPLYDWPALQRRRYRWWAQRVARSLDLFDLIRIDHFRGLVAYWAVPQGARTARSGHWRRGPGRALFEAIAAELGPRSGLPFVAEDLGVITPAVERLRDQLGLPGMIVLQFGFDPDKPDSPHRPENHAENRVVYTGTHDHDTARGWWESIGAPERELVRAAATAHGIRVGRRPWWALIDLALASPARVAMLQVQDILGLGTEARMNDPSRAGGSWRWQMEPGALTPALARRLREATGESGRSTLRPGPHS